MRKFVKSLCVLFAASGLLAGSAFATNDINPGTSITGASGVVDIAIVTAFTGQTNEPNVTGGNIDSYWYTWVAPQSGTVIFGTCNTTTDNTTNFDTTLGTFTSSVEPVNNTNLNTLTVVPNPFGPANQLDDSTGCMNSLGNAHATTNGFTAVAGVTYHIRVDGYQSNLGTARLRWNYPALTVATTDASATETPGNTAAFTVVGNIFAHSGNFTVAIGSSPQCNFAPTTLTFTPSNWNVAQTVIATPNDDVDVEGAHACSPSSIVATGNGWTGVTGTVPTLSITDNDVASFTIAKSVSPTSTSSTSTLNYTITVDNTGTTNLTSPNLTDALTINGSPLTLTSGPSLSSGDTNSDGIMQSTETWVYTATYDVTLANLNAGGTISNTATFNSAGTGSLSSSAATTTLTQLPALTMTKSGVYLNVGDDVNGNGFADAGDIVTYQYTVTNSGNVTITNVSVADVHNGVGTLSSITPATVASLNPTANVQFVATYVVQQGDVDAQ